MTVDKRLERILPRVQKPARYVGGDYNEVRKDPREVDFRFAFCFPDTYEIGMSNLGYRILYGILNDMPGVWCQRAFAPWGDNSPFRRLPPTTSNLLMTRLGFSFEANIANIGQRRMEKRKNIQRVGI